MRWQSGANTWYSNGGNWNEQPNDWSIPDWSSGEWGSQSASQTQGPNPGWGQPELDQALEPPQSDAQDEAPDLSNPYGGQGPGGESPSPSGGHMFFFDEGGAIPEDDSSPDTSDALDVVRKVLGYWRKKNGINIPGEQEDAPEAQTFDDGGSVEEAAIPEQSDDVPLPQSRPNSAPAIPENDVPADDVRKSLGKDTGVPNTELTGTTSEGIPAANTQGVGKGGLKMFMNYLMGNAATPQEAEQAKSESKGDTAAAIAAAGDDPEKATRLLQAYRKSWEARRHAAMAALDHGKMDDAVSLAASGYTDVPNGSDVQFKPSQNGVTAVVSENGKQVGNVPLTTGQFRNWLASGSFDKEVENTPAVTLQQAAKAPQRTLPMDRISTLPAADGSPSLRPLQQQEAPQTQQTQQQQETPLEIKTLEQARKVANNIYGQFGHDAEKTKFLESLMAQGGQKYPSEERKSDTSLERVKLQQSGLSQRADNRISYLDRSLSQRAADNAGKLAATYAQMGQRQKAADLTFLHGMMMQVPPVPLEKIEAFAQQKGIPLDGLLAAPDVPQAATPTAPQSVQAPPQSQAINPRAIEMLKQNASPNARMKFDQVFGRGSADRVLSGSQ